MSQIQEFYAGQNVFITGGTGFIGKILVEKLLRSCPGIETMYLLIRPKKGKNANERLAELLSNPIYDGVKKTLPDFESKIRVIKGDAAVEGLGLSAEDRTLIANKVSIIFHVAASVLFNQPLYILVANNVTSVKSVIDLSRECKNLKVAVYVSTAYSNSNRDYIEEKIYDAPLTYSECHALVDLMRKQSLPEKSTQIITKNFIGQWPNAYTFTKAIAEGTVAEYAKDLPFSIFRPSVVLAAYREPLPGWIDNILGPTGLMAGAAFGVLNSALVNVDVSADLVPVDMCCNGLIACAWETAISKRSPSEDVPVYNYTSGPENPLKIRRFIDICMKYRELEPTNHAMYHSSFIITKYAIVHEINHFFLHRIPAIVIDNIAKLAGKDLKLQKLVNRMTVAMDALGIFFNRQWTFENNRVQGLWDSLSSEDKALFPFTFRSLDWDHVLKVHVKGIRTYIFHETDDNIEQARRRQTILHVVHRVVQLVLLFLLLWIVWKVFCGRSFNGFF